MQVEVRRAALFDAHVYSVIFPLSQQTASRCDSTTPGIASRRPSTSPLEGGSGSPFADAERLAHFRFRNLAQSVEVDCANQRAPAALARDWEHC